MRAFYYKRLLCLIGWLLFALSAYAQQVDTTKLYKLSGVEVVEKARVSTTRTSNPVQIMTSTSIERLGMQDLTEAVKRFSGVTVKDYGGIGGLKTVSIRGFGAQHTAVSYDGITITDAQSGQIDLSRFSLDNVEQVSLTIGQSDDIFQTARMYASVGALSIRTNRPSFKNKDYNFRAKIGGGAFGLFTPSLQYDYKLNDRFSLSARADWISAKGEYPFTLKNGKLVTEEKRTNSDVQSLRLEGNLYGSIKGGELTAKLYYFDSERGLPGSIIYYNDYAKERLWDNNFFGQVNFCKSLSDQFTIQSSTKYSYGYNKYRNIDNKYPDGLQIDRNTQQEYYLSVGALYNPIESFSVSLTSDLSYNDLENNFTNAALPQRLTSLSVLAAQYQTTRLTLTGSLLGTFITDEVKSGDKPADRKRLSPAASLSWRPFEETNFRIRASFKDIFRVPTFTDLYYLRVGNTKLRPERALQYNLGITWSGESSLFRYMSASADIYYNKSEDKIVASPTMYVWKMINLGEVESKGVDINLQTEMPLNSHMAVLLTTNYSYQHAIDVTDKESKYYRHQIQYTPRHTGTGSVTFENPFVNLTYSLMAVDKRYSLSQNIPDNRIDGYVEQNISLNRTFRLGRTSLRLQGEILNLEDRTYDVIKYYPMPGRSWRLNAILTF
ncbi:TonB-dependent receptor [Massilibacteroides sp.]|uniref:TonB-dependent receptor plug domain-containing protein n=1 Tax=Massilibacteroides sp. TaxID=2034766 RepID=UPI0026252DEB|nr:TonB-dependent receptor [Massilibacteroides sp.]MDD4513999.1 TonB-dependent receptor [Massilibacteroides sp.]